MVTNISLQKYILMDQTYYKTSLLIYLIINVA